MSDGIQGSGVSLSIGGTAVGNIISVGGPDQSRDSIDISTMDSIEKFREFIPGMIDAGEITAELNYDATTISVLLQAQLTASADTIVVGFGDGLTTAVGPTFTCPGFMTALGAALPFDDKMTQTISLKFTGKPTYAIA